MKQDSRYCPMCERNVMAVGRPPNHVLHFLISLFTCGLWVIVWALLAFGTIGNYRCSRCGSRV